MSMWDQEAASNPVSNQRTSKVSPSNMESGRTVRQEPQYVKSNMKQIPEAASSSVASSNVLIKVLIVVIAVGIAIVICAAIAIPLALILTRTSDTTTLTTTTTLSKPVAISSSPAFCTCPSASVTLSLSNNIYSSSNVIYQWESSPAGTNNWSNFGSQSASASATITTQTSSTDYRCRIIIQGSTSTNVISTVVTIVYGTAYCLPNVYSCSSGNMIDTFILDGEYGTQIYDTATGCATNGYDNRTGETVSLFAGVYCPFIISTPASNLYGSIWIDFNDDFSFTTSANEQVWTGSLTAAVAQETGFTMPSTATIGVHRMRVVIFASSMSGASCAPSNPSGETHDYTVNIVPYVAADAVIKYSENFTAGVVPTNQCTSWKKFTSQLVNRQYTSMKIYGSRNPTGITITDTNIISSITNSLRTSTSSNFHYFGSGPYYRVGQCGNGIELSIGSSSTGLCTCTSEYTIRPCHGTTNFGEIGLMTGNSCFGSTQSMTIEFSYQ